MGGTGIAQHVVRTDDDNPMGIDLAVGAVAIVIATFGVSMIPRADAAWRCAIVALAIGVFAALSVDLLAVAVLVPITWLIVNGFLVNRLGNLSWHGTPDLYRFLALTGAGVCGLAVGGITHRAHGIGYRSPRAAQVLLLRTDITRETEQHA